MSLPGKRMGTGALVAVVVGLAVWWIGRAGSVIDVPGDYPSVAQALAHAPPGAVIRLQPGTYRESLMVRAPVTIEGPRRGEAVIAGIPDLPVVTIADTVGVTLRRLSITGGEMGVLVTASDGVLIAENRITANRLRGVRVVFGSARIVGNVVSDNDGKGIHIGNSSTRPLSVVEGNTVERNGGEGILTNLAQSRIRRNTVRDNGLDGISVSEMSEANVVGNAVTANHRAGILVMDMSMARVERNRVAGSRGDGIRLEFHSQADLAGNRIDGNQGCAVATGLGSIGFERRNQTTGNGQCATPDLQPLEIPRVSTGGLAVILVTGGLLLLLPVALGGHRWPVYMFVAAAVVQIFHQLEHVAQVVQAHVLGWKTPHGLAGAAIDTEWVHIGFNSVLTIALAAILLGYGWSGVSSWAKRSRVSTATLLAGVALQGYHQVEHLVKIVQHTTLGTTPAPGILGNVFDLVWLHFWINLAVTVAVVVGLLGLGIVRHVGPIRRLAPVPV